MAAGEYVSVSSQHDTEQSDLARERKELAEDPEAEILMCAVASETEGPFLLVNPKWESVRASDPLPQELFNLFHAAFELREGEIWAHNAQFEFAITERLIGQMLDVHITEALPHSLRGRVTVEAVEALA